MTEPSQTSSRAIGFWLAAIAAVLFSFKAILAKLMYRYPIDATSIIALRMLFSGPVFAVIAGIETYRARKRGDRLTWSDCALLVLLGFLGYYLSSFMDFWGLQYVSASLERLILFLTPTAVALLSLFFLRKPITGLQWFGMAVSYFGVILVFAEGLSLQGKSVAFGSMLITIAMLSYASYLVMSGEVIKRLGAIRLVAYVMTLSALMTAVHFVILGQPNGLIQPMHIYQLSIANAVFCTIVPVYLTMFAVMRIGATSTSQMSMLGPVSLLFFGHWILGEAITALQLLGTATVLLGVGLLTRRASVSAEKTAA
jgi:drug/metabolite transporter (DMT)-like permease